MVVMNMEIVCTGYGVIAPNTKNIDEFLFNLQNGVCCLELDNKLTPHHETNIVGFIKNGLEEYEGDRKFNRLPKVTQIGVVSAKEAIKSAQLDLENKKVGLFFGTAIGAIGEDVFQEGYVNAVLGDYRHIPITFCHSGNHHSITAAVGNYIGTNGVTKTITTGCTSSLEAIEEAMVYLKAGLLDVAIVGGAEASINKATTCSFAKTRSLPLNQDLEAGGVPFQEGSGGFAMAEASGTIILERKEDALKRGANIKGEIVEVVSNNDGVSIFSTEEKGTQIGKALEKVTSGRRPNYVNSQALGISTNDQIERKWSKTLFNNQIPYTSIKSMYGNPFGATGVLQVISSLLSIEYNFIPPTIRTSKKGFEDMNIVTQTKYQGVNEVAVTNHGYGGNNACAYIKRVAF
jgi:3-oxoacyl-(acyl-carrier-protein) synthase